MTRNSNSDLVTEINRSKRSFLDSYNSEEPFEYFATMASLDYQIPQNAKAFIEFLLYELRCRKPTEGLSVVDIGCSYGVLSSLIKYNLDLNVLYSKYVHRKKPINYNSLPCREYIDFYGVDISSNAIDYSLKNGLLASGCAGNLELASDQALMSPHFPSTCDMIVSTGCFGYVTERTFVKLLSHMSGSLPPLLATFVMEPFEFGAAAEALKAFGYSTREFTARKFRQRRYSDGDERNLLLGTGTEGGHGKIGGPERDYIYARLHVSQHQSAIPTKLFDCL